MIVLLGADGFIGRYLFQVLQITGTELVGTSLKSDPTGKLLQVDVRKPSAVLRNAIEKAAHVICAISSGSIDVFAQDPVGTRAVNVTALQQLLSHMKPGATPVYLSTNMVFQGDVGGYAETDTPHPTTEYGRQKFEMESWIQRTFRRSLTVRLTKVYGLTPGDGTLFTAWQEALRNNQEIRVASDMMVAPVFVGDVVNMIARLVRANASGIFHIPGPVTDSMAQLALQAGEKWGSERTLIKNVRRADLAWHEMRPQFHTLTVSRQPVAEWQKDFLTPQAAFSRLAAA